MRMVVPLIIIMSATNIVGTHAQKQEPEKPPALAAPYRTYPDRKPFSAVQLGPDNTIRSVFLILNRGRSSEKCPSSEDAASIRFRAWPSTRRTDGLPM